MSRAATARAAHGVIAAIATFALILQLVLVVDGASVLETVNQPGVWLRIGRYFCYFTIQSNILVAAGTAWLCLRPSADGQLFRAVRLAGLLGITVTGVVHYVALRPLLNLSGWSWVADKSLHIVVPIVAILGWLVWGPRGRVDRRTIALSYLWPLAWLAWTVVVAALTDWFPYPFLNWHVLGAGPVVVAGVGIFAFATVLFAVYAWLDRRLPGAPPA